MSIRPMVATILFSMGTLSLACSHSPTAPSVIGCSTDALRGSYGSQRNGQAAPGTAFTSVGLAIFDGVGHLTEQVTVSTNGVFSTANQSGAYTMDTDCNGTLTDSNGSTVAKLTMVHGNDEVLGMSVIPGSNVAMHFERVTSGCTNASLKGQYGFQRNGQTGPGAPLLALGIAIFDGNGHGTAQQTIDRSGVIGPTSAVLEGMYALNPDCTGTLMDLAGNVMSPLVVVHGGDEALGMSMTPGNNVVIHYERTK
jgi:hypothetical protein